LAYFTKCSSLQRIAGDDSCQLVQRPSERYRLALTNKVADESSDIVYAEFLVNFTRAPFICIGAVKQRDDMELSSNDSCFGSNSDSYSINLYDGGLWGNGKCFCDRQGEGCVQPGDRIGVLVTLGEQGSVRFFKNGELFGPGFTTGERTLFGGTLGPVRGPLVIAVEMYDDSAKDVCLLSDASSYA
jgi:hypothetical protein